VLVSIACAGIASAQDSGSGSAPGPNQASGKAAESQKQPPAAGQKEPAKQAGLPASLQETLERTNRELKAVRDELEQQRKRAEIQHQQIEVLKQQTELLTEQLNQRPAGQDEVIEKLQAQTATLAARAAQAAVRDQELANATDDLKERLEVQTLNPSLPAKLRELFSPHTNNAIGPTIFISTETNYTLPVSQRGAGTLQLLEFSPFFLSKVNERLFLSGESVIVPSGVSLEQAQVDYFINDWLTADVGYFISPTGFMNERLNMP
jgi:hypothetical protein